MVQSQKVFLQLVSEGLKEHPQAVGAALNLSDKQWQEICEYGRKHSLLAVLYDGMNACYHANITSVYPYMEQISREELPQTIAQYHIYFETNRICKAFQQAWITAVVLKGATVGACYKMPELRKSGDVDLWIFDLENFEGARYQEVSRIMESMGFFWDLKKSSQHQRVFQNAKGLKVEIHKSFCDLFPEAKRNRAIASFQKGIQEKSLCKIKVLERYEFLSLSRIDMIFYNLIHMAQHYYMKGFGWKFICDWAMMLKAPLNKEEKMRLYRLIKDAKMLNFAEAITFLAIRYFGLEEKNVDFLLDGAVSEDALELLTTQVFEAGEYGTDCKERLYTPGKNSMRDLFAVFHLQMLKNFEKASKIVILWPVLWLFTLCKFLYNNKRLRHVSTFEVLKDAKNRGAQAEAMNLFGR